MNCYRSKGNKHILVHDKMLSIKYADEFAENSFFFPSFVQIQFQFLLEHIFQFSKFILLIHGWTWFPVLCQMNIVLGRCASGQKRGIVSVSGDIQLNCNNDTMWLNTRQNVESHFPNKWMNLLWTVDEQKKMRRSPLIRHIHTLATAGTIYLFAHCLQCSCADYISYRIQMRRCFFLCPIRIIDICILMNILLCAYIILCQTTRSRSTPLAVVSIVRFFFQSLLSNWLFLPLSPLQSIINLNFDSWKWTFTLETPLFCCKQANEKTIAHAHSTAREWKTISSCQREPPMPTIYC